MTAVLCIILAASQTVCFAAYNTIPTKMYPKMTEVEIASGTSPDMEMHIKFSNNVSAVDEEQIRDVPDGDQSYMYGVNARNLTKFHMYEKEGDKAVSDEKWKVAPHPEAKKQTDTSKYFYIYGYGLDTENDYYIIVDEDLYANMGNSLGTSYVIDFNIGKETCSFHAEGELPDDTHTQAPLTLDMTSVENGQKDVPVDSIFYFRFSFNVAGEEVLAYNSEQMSLVKVSDKSKVPIEVTKGGEMQELTVTLQDALETGTEYKFVFTKNFVARNGIALSSPLNLYFITEGDGPDASKNPGDDSSDTDGGSDSGSHSGGNTSGDRNNTDDKDDKNDTDNDLPVIEIDYFPDIEDSWARNDINILADMGIVTGSTDGNFGPSRQITRAEIVVMLVRLFDLDSENMTVYSDTRNHWARGYISIASSLGYVKGISADKFAPNNMLTRQEMATILTRIAGLKVVEETEDSSTKADAASDSDAVTEGSTQSDAGEANVEKSTQSDAGEANAKDSIQSGDSGADAKDAAKGKVTFTDASDIASWAAESVEAVRSNGIVSGYPDGSFRPKANITRAEACHMIVNLLKLQKKNQ